MCTKHLAKCFSYILFSTHNIKVDILSITVLQMKKLGSERWYYLP